MEKGIPRLIKVSYPQLRRFRKTLRLILREAFNSRVRNICEQVSICLKNVSLSPFEREKEIAKLGEEEKLLGEAYWSAPLGCAVCGTGAIEDDLKFNRFNRQWFCEICYNENQEYYKKNPHPWLPNWKTLYP